MGLNQIGRENGKRPVMVQVKVAAMQFPAGMYIDWGGTFESPAIGTSPPRDRGTDLLPRNLCAALHRAGRFHPRADRVLGGAEALAGGVFALLLRGIPFSITAAVGFIAPSGAAVLNGLVMMSAIREHREYVEDEDQAIVIGGLVTSTILTLLVLPAITAWMARFTARRRAAQQPHTDLFPAR